MIVSISYYFSNKVFDNTQMISGRRSSRIWDSVGLFELEWEHSTGLTGRWTNRILRLDKSTLFQKLVGKTVRGLAVNKCMLRGRKWCHFRRAMLQTTHVLRVYCVMSTVKTWVFWIENRGYPPKMMRSFWTAPNYLQKGAMHMALVTTVPQPK